MCSGWPGVMRGGDVLQPAEAARTLPNQLAIVAGNSSRLEAKIGGITPDMLSLNGRCVLWPAYMRRPCWRFA